MAKHTPLDPEDGIEQDTEEFEAEDLLREAREALPYLKTATDGEISSYVKSRWDRLEKKARKVQAELKVNYLRYSGIPFAQLHPDDPTRTYVPASAKQKLPPVLNKTRRAVHRYMAQVTADDPIMEGVPDAHTDEARDAAEAATDVLRGEWERMKLTRELRRTVHFSCIYRSAFWHFEWDDAAGGKVPAQKFDSDPATGERILRYVNGSGDFVEDPEEAAEIWQGNTCVDVLTPMNVRWTGSEFAHDADELLIGKLVTLRQVYEMFPKLRQVKLSELLGHVPPRAEEWLHNMKGDDGTNTQSSKYDDEELGGTGESMRASDSKLDDHVLLTHYFVKPSKTYPKGYHVITAGKYTAFRGPLKYGRIPVAHFKLLDDPADSLGIGLVDLLRDPQELMDFVNAQVLRWLQTLKSRWFVPMGSQVKARDLLSETRSIIQYNPNGGAPTREQSGELPRSLDKWVDRFDQAFDDELGIHDTMQGKHVPGVSSGRHAEALRSGDETVLGLTRTQIQTGLEVASEIILAMVKEEWTIERRISYFDGREYMESAFSATDLGNTSQVRLKRGTMLMLTPAQKLETLFGYMEMGALTVDELRRMAPLSDTAGISVTEDPHYKRARRENSRWLSGPPEELQAIRDEYEAEMRSIESGMDFLKKAAEAGGVETRAETEDASAALEGLQIRAQRAEGAWMEAVSQWAPTVEQWELSDPKVLQVHMTEHMKGLAHQKVERLPRWWKELFVQHTMQHVQALQQLMAPPPEAPPQQ